jgi:hypothetical protein
MQRKTPGEKCERLKNLHAGPLRQQCARFVLDHAEAIVAAHPQIPPGLNDRAADIWEPLLALADLAGGDWPDLARHAAVGLSASAQEADPIGALLWDIFVLFATSQVNRMFSRTLVEALNGFTERPWSALRKGKAITELWLAQQLRPYGVRPRTIWIGDTAAKGYLDEDFREAFQRYIPRSEIEAMLREPKKPEPQTTANPPAQPTALPQVAAG